MERSSYIIVEMNKLFMLEVMKFWLAYQTKKNMSGLKKNNFSEENLSLVNCCKLLLNPV